MHLDESRRLIHAFMPSFPKGPGDAEVKQRLEVEFGGELPQELRLYVSSFVPAKGVALRTVGNPIHLFAASGLSQRVDGFSHNALTGEPSSQWDDRWLLIAQQGAEPIAVDTRKRAETSRVFQALPGGGRWDFFPIADSVAQFLLLAAARHHAFTNLAEGDPFTDNEDGFQLREESAGWLFPRVREWGARYYDVWLEDFANR